MISMEWEIVRGMEKAEKKGEIRSFTKPDSRSSKPPERDIDPRDPSESKTNGVVGINPRA